MSQDEIRAALQLRPRDALRLTLIGEAAGETPAGRTAVACAIRNRVLTDLHHDNKPDWWGEGYAAVCLARWQFSCWWELTAPNTQRLYALAARLLTNTLAAADVVLLGSLNAIVDGVMSGVIPDTTHGATHYLTNALLSDAPPKWAIGKRPCAIVSHHSFFADIG